MTTIESIEAIESRFKEVTGLTHLDLSTPHFKRGDDQQQKTTKQQFKDFGWVCTPLWLVDEMLEPEIPNLTLTSTTCDACSGCGQVVARIKQLTTNYLWKKQGEHLRKYYWKQHHILWTHGYFCSTIGDVSESTLKNYIENQG